MRQKPKGKIPKRMKEPDPPQTLDVRFDEKKDFSNSVARRCEMTLRSRLNAPSLRLVANNYANNNIRFELKGSSFEAKAGSRSYTVFPLRDLTDPFWVGLHMDFVLIKTHLRLTAASLVVFHGARDGPRVPILRAEWDCPSSDARRRHAQPHWHVYQRQAVQDLVLPPPQEPQLAVVRSLDDYRPGEPLFTDRPAAVPKPHPVAVGDLELVMTSIGGENVHLAMSAEWHKDEGGHSVHFTETSLARWLDRCITYLLVQLDLAA
ncbi:MAG TPA: hypothetical protein VF647_04005 [Longimicrobium sp.]|jgi:hypothetical protein